MRDKPPSHPNGFETKPGDFARPHLKLPLSITSLLHNIATTYRQESCFPRPSVPGLAIFSLSPNLQDKGSTAWARSGLPPSCQRGGHRAEQHLCYMEVYLCCVEVNCPCWATLVCSAAACTGACALLCLNAVFVSSQTITLPNLDSLVSVFSCDLVPHLQVQAEDCRMRLHDAFPLQTNLVKRLAGIIHCKHFAQTKPIRSQWGVLLLCIF